ncbi:MAG: sulfate adenylyltransferase subunit CysN [Hyphomicrobiaceae bacterium]|nr:sulfate adenylyltransferase subunit CysN [Hyphomicrobiaceae bacterium]
MYDAGTPSRAREDRGLLRFLTCGSVDDGKSTLIGRLLYDSKLILEDQLSALEKDSRKHGTTGEDIDLALLVDGLEAEREQGITIDVAYRFFTTGRRSFIVADTPGHEQYTRNMATGASNSDLAVILIDARKGVLVQTKRHSTICSLLGIRDIVVAVNKIDLVDFDAAVFERIVAEYSAFAAELGFRSITAIPMSARFGDNVTSRSDKLDWYHGPTLVEFLEQVDVDQDREGKPFRFPVQWVNRPNLDFRGFSGTIVSGAVAVGERLKVAVSGKESTVARIVTADGDLPRAIAGQAVTITLADEIDIARGDVLAKPEAPVTLTDRLAAHVLWMSAEPLLIGRSYLMRIGTQWVPATVTAIRHKLDVNTRALVAGTKLDLNEIGLCELTTARPTALDPYADNRDTGAFILVDRFTNQTAAAGMVAGALRQDGAAIDDDAAIDKLARARLKNQKPTVVWFTGLSGSGKSAVAKAVERRLAREGQHTSLIDADALRRGLSRDLGFSDVDRSENIRRAGEVARLALDAGLIVLCAFVSPFAADRAKVKALFEPGEFIEIFVDTPIDTCVRRDPKGLYRRAQAGEIDNVPGLDGVYERPEAADLSLNGADEDTARLADRVVALLRERARIQVDEGWVI